MKIYFAGSIAGGRDYVDMYFQFINYLKAYGEVLTEHVGKEKYDDSSMGYSPKHIHDRDVAWLTSAQVIVADCTMPSLGVGYEIATAISQKKKILCLFNAASGKRLSAMIEGSPYVTVGKYSNVEEAKIIIDEFFKKL